MATGGVQDVQAEDPEAEDQNGKGRGCLRWGEEYEESRVLVYRDNMRQMETRRHGRK